MRVLVVSDIHSNLVALDAVLADAGAYDIVWSLGDSVGYGPYPNECIERLSDVGHAAIPGNHDWGVLGRLDLQDFNPDARAANVWSRQRLSGASTAYLQGLTEVRLEEGVTLAHGSPRHPIREYLFHTSIAMASFGFYRTALCLVGHTHVPALFRLEAEEGECQLVVLPERQPVQLDDARYIINPGSVGQPRDGDPRAAYMLLDTHVNVVEQRRVSYDVESVQEAMRRAGLPRRLSARLALGL